VSVRGGVDPFGKVLEPRLALLETPLGRCGRGGTEQVAELELAVPAPEPLQALLLLGQRAISATARPSPCSKAGVAGSAHTPWPSESAPTRRSSRQTATRCREGSAGRRTASTVQLDRSGAFVTVLTVSARYATRWPA
jgi:hypothetical protein